MSPCDLRKEEKEWKGQTEKKYTQDRNEDRVRHRHRRGAGKDSERQKSSQKNWLFCDSSSSMVGKMVSSHAPVVRLKNLGLLHSIQQSNSTHGCLVGWELVIPPSLHLLAALVSKPQASAFCLPCVSWTPQNKETSSAFWFSLRDTGEHKQHYPTAQVVLALGDASWSWKIKMRSCQAESGAPAVRGPSRWCERWGPNVKKKKRTKIV